MRKTRFEGKYSITGRALGVRAGAQFYASIPTLSPYLAHRRHQVESPDPLEKSDDPFNTKHSSHLQGRKRQFILEARLSDHDPEID